MKHVFRFFAKKLDEDSHWIILDRSEIQHLKKVLKLKIGDFVEVFDGKGNVAFGKILSTHHENEGVLVDSEESKFFPYPEKNIHVLMGAIKPSDWEQILPSLVEVGVDKMIIFGCEGAAKFRLEDKIKEKCEKIILNAAKQCKRTYLPVLSFHKNLGSALAENLNTLESSLKITFEASATKKLKELTPIDESNISIVIGGEAGISLKEREQLKENNFTEVTLGSNILRAKTAAPACAFFFSQLF